MSISHPITKNKVLVARIISFANNGEATSQAQAIGPFDLEQDQFFHSVLAERFPTFKLSQINRVLDAMHFPEGTSNQVKLNEILQLKDLDGILQGTMAFRTLGGNGPGNRMDQFNQPAAITINKHEVYITDYWNERVQVWNISGEYMRSIGPFPSSGQELNEFGNSEGIAVGEELYVSDKFNHRVQIFTKEGSFLKTIPLRSPSHPQGLAINEKGFLYATRPDKDSVLVFPPIRRIDPLNMFVRSIRRKPSEEYQVSSPGSVAVSRGIIFITSNDFINAGIYAFDSQDRSLLNVLDLECNGGGSDLSGSEDSSDLSGSEDSSDGGGGTRKNQVGGQEFSVSVSPNGLVYLTDTLNHRVQIFSWSRAGFIYHRTIGGNGPGNRMDQFNQPGCAAISQDGVIYVTDTNNHRVQLFLEPKLPSVSAHQIEGPLTKRLKISSLSKHEQMK